MNRREFFRGAASMVLLPGLVPRLAQEAPKGSKPVVVSTWSFGKKANARAWEVLHGGGKAIDAVEKGINDAELDPENNSVGWGGLPDENGEVTLDACIHDGPTHRGGAVGCLKRIRTAISVARKVLEKTRHTFLVGEDATEFAKKMGFKEQSLLTEKAKKIWEAWKADPRRNRFWRDRDRGHDTIGMVALDRNGDLCAGCSTSGLAFKIPGRVGDSPILGAGAYCDNGVGAAAATGNGDVMMRFLPSYQAVEFMRMGLSPGAACRAALKRIVDKGYRISAGLIAVDREGRVGAARIGWAEFPYSVRNEHADEIRRVQ